MRFNSLPEWLAWQETCHAKSIDLGLERVREVAGRLKLLSPQATVTTVAGTNGKGSCARALELMLLADGHSVGIYTSPHIIRYNERIGINGRLVDDGALCAAFAAVDEARGDISLSYFEFGTLAAMWLFEQNQCSHWVLEVGLGGRLDATNIIDANIAVITSIGLDHCDWLGDTREAIGYEKAGICRANRPLVCAEFDIPGSILEVVYEKACPMYCIGKDFSYDVNAAGYYRVGPDTVSVSGVTLPQPSVAAALQVMALLGCTDIHKAANALKQARLPGRMQCLEYRGREVVLDVAHNPAAFEFLVGQLKQAYPGERFVIVLGMMADKNAALSIAELAGVAAGWVLTGIPGNERAASVEALQVELPYTTDLAVADNPLEALDLAVAQAGAGRVLVTGSFYTVAAVLGHLQRETL